MEFCEAGSLDSLYKKVKSKGWRTGEKVLGKIADSVNDFFVRFWRAICLILFFERLL